MSWNVVGLVVECVRDGGLRGQERGKVRRETVEVMRQALKDFLS